MSARCVKLQTHFLTEFSQEPFGVSAKFNYHPISGVRKLSA